MLPTCTTSRSSTVLLLSALRSSADIIGARHTLHLSVYGSSRRTDTNILLLYAEKFKVVYLVFRLLWSVTRLIRETSLHFLSDFYISFHFKLLTVGTYMLMRIRSRLFTTEINNIIILCGTANMKTVPLGGLLNSKIHTCDSNPCPLK